MKTAKELLESDNLLAEPDVVVAYWRLRGKTRWKHDVYSHKAHQVCCSKCGEQCQERYSSKLYRFPCFVPDPIPGSLADAAEEMRDACQRNEIAGGKGHWNKELGNITGNGDTYNLLFATVKQRIIAAVLAERGQG